MLYPIQIHPEIHCIACRAESCARPTDPTAIIRFVLAHGYTPPLEETALRAAIGVTALALVNPDLMAIPREAIQTVRYQLARKLDDLIAQAAARDRLVRSLIADTHPSTAGRTAPIVPPPPPLPPPGIEIATRQPTRAEIF